MDETGRNPEEQLLTAAEISKQVFNGIVKEQEIEDYLDHKPVYGIEYTADYKGLYPKCTVEECEEHFDPQNYLKAPVLTCFKSFENPEDVLNFVQKLICEAHHQSYNEWGYTDGCWRFISNGGGFMDDAIDEAEQSPHSHFYACLAAERYLYTAMFGYIWTEAPEREQDGNTLGEFINAMEIRNYDSEFKNAVDILFEELEEKDPHHFAVFCYNKYKQIQRLMKFSPEDLFPDLAEWLCRQYWYPEGFWGIRERNFADWHWRETHNPDEYYPKYSEKSLLTVEYNVLMESQRNGTAVKYGVLPEPKKSDKTEGKSGEGA